VIYEAIALKLGPPPTSIGSDGFDSVDIRPRLAAVVRTGLAALAGALYTPRRCW
jgi:hypothetical protein